MKRPIFAALLLSATAIASAATAETVPVKDGKVTVSVSSAQMTRFTVRGDKIVSAKTMQDPDGPQILLKTNADTGEVFVGFDGDVTGRTFAVYFTTSAGDTDLVVLHPDTSEARNVELAGEVHQATPGRSTLKMNGYSETLVAFMKVLFNGDPGEGVECRDIAEAPKKTPVFLVTQVRSCSTDGLRGFVLQMQNITNQPAQVTSDQFMLKQVVAAGVSNELVQPGESTRVYVEEEHIP